MVNKSKRFLSLLLALVMVIALMPMGYANAAENTITMKVGDMHTIENVAGNYEGLTDELGVVKVDVVFTPEMTERTAALASNIEEGAEYVLVNTRLWKALEYTTSANNRLFCRETVANAPAWTIKAVDNGYTVQTADGAYLQINSDGTTGTSADPQTLEITKVDGTDAWVLKQNGQYLCDFNNNNGGAAYDAGGYGVYNDNGNKWLFYKVSDAQAYSWSLANNGEKVSAVESGKKYVFEQTTSSKLLSNQWNDKGGGGNGTGAFLKLNGTKNEITSLNVWNVTSTDTDGIYRVTDANGLHLRVNNGRADVTAEVTDIQINCSEGATSQIGQVRSDATWYLNRWGGTYNNSIAVGGWSDVTDVSSQFNIYEVTGTALGTSDVTFTAETVGETTVTIGDTIYTINVTNPAAEEPKVTVEQIDVNLTAQIALGYIVDIPENAGAETVVLTKGDVFVEYEVANLDVNAEGKYLVSMPIDSIEMDADVTIEVKDADGTAIELFNKAGESLTTAPAYSVVDFANLVLDNTNNSAERKALAKALLTYGAYAVAHFDGGYPDYGNQGVELTGITADDVVSYKTVQTKAVEGIKATRINANLKSYIYYRVDLDLADGAVVTLDGQPVDMTGKNYVEIPNITAITLDDTYTITVTNGNNEVNEIETSVLGYVYAVLNNDQNKQTKVDLAKAMYNYSLAAEAYFDTVNTAN